MAGMICGGNAGQTRSKLPQENVENIILEHLRYVRGKIDQTADDVREVKNRLANLEATQGTTLQHIGHLSSMLAQQQVAFDKMTERIERLEECLEIAA